VERAKAIRSSADEYAVRPAEPHGLPKLLTLPEVAEVLHVSPKTVRRLMRRGPVGRVRGCGRCGRWVW